MSELHACMRPACSSGQSSRFNKTLPSRECKRAVFLRKGRCSKASGFYLEQRLSASVSAFLCIPLAPWDFCWVPRGRLSVTEAARPRTGCRPAAPARRAVSAAFASELAVALAPREAPFLGLLRSRLATAANPTKVYVPGFFRLS